MEIINLFCSSIIFLIMLITITLLIVHLINSNSRIKNLESIIITLKDQINSINNRIYRNSQIQIEEISHKESIEPINKHEKDIKKEIYPAEIANKAEPPIEKTIKTPEDTTDEEKQIKENVIPDAIKGKKGKPKFKISYEELFGGRILNIIGSIMLIIGIGFFLKYAFDNQWISETFRALMGGFIGVGFILGGVHFYKKDYSTFAQGLIGTGISIIYLSIYAAHNLYHLTSHPVAFILMIATTILSFYLALKYNSIAVSFLGLIGGFLTPFLLASEETNFNALLAYIAFLNISVFTLVLKKDNWRSLELFALIATYLTFFPVSLYYDLEYGNTKTIFLIFTWLIYTGLDFSRSYRGISSSRFLEYLTPALSAFFFYIGINFTLGDTNNTLAGSTILLAALVYIALNTYLIKRDLRSQSFDKKTTITAIIYIVFATNTLYEGFNVIILWSIEALLALIIGITSNRPYIWKTGLIIYLILPFKLLLTGNSFGYSNVQDYSPIINIRTLAYFTFIGSIITGIHFINKLESTSKQIIIPIFRYFWCVLLFILLNVELNDYYKLLANNFNREALEYNQSIMRFIMWVLYSMPLLKYGIKKNITPFTICGSIILSIATICIIIKGYTYVPIENYIPLINIRFMAFAIIIVSILFINKWIENTRPLVVSILKYCWCIILFILLNIELNDYFKYISMSTNVDLSFNQSMIRSILWALYSLPLIKYGLKKNINPYSICGSLVLSISAIILIVSGSIYSPIASFVPVINIRFLAFAIIISSILFVYSCIKESNYEWKLFAMDFLKYFSCTIVFIVLTSEINSYFAKLMYITHNSFNESITYNKFLVFDLCWCLYSLPLIWLGLKRKILPFLLLGLISLGLGLFMGLILSFTYPSIESFSLIINSRFFVIAVLIAVLIATHNLFKGSIEEHTAYRVFIRILKVLICGFIFLLATTEATTFFNQQMIQISDDTTKTPIETLKNQKQFVLSAIWMIYSILLIIWGIFKRSKVIRITSMIIFSITILKIFIIDLAFLDHLYRIISFVGMGVILIFASYLYQKYKDIILEPEEY